MVSDGKAVSLYASATLCIINAHCSTAMIKLCFGSLLLLGGP
jgi:hypothetical protein